MEHLKKVSVIDVDSNFIREKLKFPFGFKGGYLTELWQTAVAMESSTGAKGVGLATQSVLYGDSNLFASCSEPEGNALMYLLACRALQKVKREPFGTPIELFDRIWDEVYEEGKFLTGQKSISPNFVYNALVSVDNAAWTLYAAENAIRSYDLMIPEPYRPALAHRNKEVGILYQVSYTMPLEAITQAADEGYFIFKIKTGFPGSQEEMLAKDMERLTQIHDVLKNYRTARTPHGKLCYTMDANGRYESKETLKRYLDHAQRIGALDHILFYEEPFSELSDETVFDIGVPIAADESANDESSTKKRIEQGYGVVVLKGIAKTLSHTLRIAKLAFENNIPCACSDLTVNPVLVDWHKNLAARLIPFPGLGMALMETNGDANYVNWEKMEADHPRAHAEWTKRKQGVFELDDDFYSQSGGIFDIPGQYAGLLKKVR